MAKRLGAATFIERAHAKGATYRQIAAGLNRSVSTIFNIRKGRNSGESVREAARQFAMRKPPERGARVAPVSRAPRAAGPQPGTVTVHRGFTTTYLSRTRKAYTFDHIPDNAEILRALKGRTAKDVQLVITFVDGHVARLLTKGWNKERMAQVLEDAKEEWLLAFLEKERGYKGRGPNPSHDGISSVQVVLY